MVLSSRIGMMRTLNDFSRTTIKIRCCHMVVIIDNEKKTIDNKKKTGPKFYKVSESILGLRI